ncbi:lysine exporter LysO family protein [Aeropyrum camini]|nr:LysO family transporter [Aeropyrum camini]
MELALPAVAGLLAGFYMRGAYSHLVERLIYPVVWALVFTIGTGVGSRIEPDVAAEILYGSLLVALLPGAASVAVAFVLTRLASQGDAEEGRLVASSYGGIRSPVIILVFLIAGTAVGRLAGHPLSQDISTMLLYVLLLQAGYLVGGSVGLRGIISGGRVGGLLALSCIIGGLLGGAAAAHIAGWSVGSGAAMGMASGWYSLVGPILYTEDPYLGVVALLGNMLRETLHIIAYPILARRMPIAAVALGGATTMDTGLPVVLASAGERAALPAFVQGAMLTLILSVILPLYVSII